MKISLQLDEANDLTKCSLLIALVWHVSEGTVTEDFLFCEELNTGEYHLVEDFLAKINGRRRT